MPVSQVSQCRTRAVATLQGYRDIVEAVTPSIGKGGRPHPFDRHANQGASPVNKVAELADDAATATFLLRPMVARQEPGIYADMNHHRFSTLREEASKLARQRGESAVEANHEEWRAIRFLFPLINATNLLQLSPAGCKRLFHEDEFVVRNRSGHVRYVTVMTGKDKDRVDIRVLEQSGRCLRSCEAKPSPCGLSCYTRSGGHGF